MRREKVAADGTQGTSIVVCAVTEPAGFLTRICTQPRSLALLAFCLALFLPPRCRPARSTQQHARRGPSTMQYSILFLAVLAILGSALGFQVRIIPVLKTRRGAS